MTNTIHRVVSSLPVVFYIVLCSLVLVSCGNSGESSGQGSVGLYFTDAAGDDFSSVNVRVNEVNLCSDNNCENKVNVFTNISGLAINLAELDGVMQFVEMTEIPVATYNRLETRMSKNLLLEDQDGIHQAVFVPMDSKPNKPNQVQCEEVDCFIRFNGTVNPFAEGKLIIDFDLKDMEVDTSAEPWEVTEVKMMPITPSATSAIYMIYGIVNSADALTGRVSIESSGTDFTITGIDPSAVEVGDCLKVKTNDAPSETSILTISDGEWSKEDISRCNH